MKKSQVLSSDHQMYGSDSKLAISLYAVCFVKLFNRIDSEMIGRMFRDLNQCCDFLDCCVFYSRFKRLLDKTINSRKYFSGKLNVAK